MLIKADWVGKCSHECTWCDEDRHFNACDDNGLKRWDFTNEMSHSFRPLTWLSTLLEMLSWLKDIENILVNLHINSECTRNIMSVNLAGFTWKQHGTTHHLHLTQSISFMSLSIIFTIGLTLATVHPKAAEHEGGIKIVMWVESVWNVVVNPSDV